MQTQLDSKKRDFYEYAAKELQELLDCGKLDEVVFNLFFISFLLLFILFAIDIYHLNKNNVISNVDYALIKFIIILAKYKYNRYYTIIG